ncbi:C6 transcription factor [Colletotrichum karsti]|uniref:C6 transcription factor n=1 Tax=Colletotrichum karsti TaxID=1095194 RepID=A0A9P6I3Y4_9PEZI|nr:C6 transcription factor [Colletotrichum karsti]KAF9875390.1 C6 transcription factor [Colletotrichum karsti]
MTPTNGPVSGNSFTEALRVTTIPPTQPVHSPFRDAQDDLLSALGKALPYAPLEDVLSTCIDLYMQWEFPTGPVICEPMLRQAVPVVVPILRGETSIPSISVTGHSTSDVSTLRVFALLTGICAFVSSSLPTAVFSTGSALAWPFLRTSREALRLYQDYDVEHPESSSIIIRYFHSNALHALGKTRVSWHVMGEALRLVQEMRLYDESSFQGLEWPEAHLRRNAFWHLYIGDKSASILQKVPISLHQMCLDTPIDTVFDENLVCNLMSSNSNIDGFETQLRVGFYLCFRLWYTASEMLIDLNLLSRLQNRGGTLTTAPATDTSSLRTSIMQSYFDFMSILQNCPTWIKDPSSAGGDNQADPTAQFRIRSFATQRANLFVTFHALRLVLLSRFTDRGFADLLGLTNDPIMLSLRKVEIASDLVAIVTELPFEALLANGEPCVEKLRQVGVALLEIMHNVGNEAISNRAKSLFSTLLDILARLNSRVSDELSSDR